METKPTKNRVLLSWSGGKDCAWALHLLQQNPEFEVVGLLTTVNQHFGRVAMHGFREELLDLQGEAAGLPLWKVPLPWPCSNQVYESLMAEVCREAVSQGLFGIAYGDLFLEDVRAYRVEKMAGTGLAPIFPCWLIPTGDLVRQMIAAGVRAHLVCVDPRKMDRKFAGRVLDDLLLSELPESVDPCGERGEFHTYVSAGPMFSGTIEVSQGEIVERDNFVYADLLPAANAKHG